MFALLGELLIVLQNDGRLLWFQLLQQSKQLLRVEGLKVMVGSVAGVPADGDDRQTGLAVFQLLDQLRTRHALYSGVQDRTVDAWELLQSLDGFRSTVCGDYVELRGFNNELTGRDATRLFTVYDEKKGLSMQIL